MNKFFLIMSGIFLINNTASASSKKASEVAEIFFEPSLVVCQKSADGLLDCIPAENNFNSNMNVVLEQIAQINELEVWKGESLLELSSDEHWARFQVTVNMQRTVDSLVKNYDIIFSISDASAGKSTYSVSMDDLAKLNMTKINLPEIRNKDKIYIISLKYGSKVKSFRSEMNKIPVTKIDEQSFYKIGDLVIDVESLGDVNARGARPVLVDRWEDGVLPIIFKSGTSQKIMDLIWSACRVWSSVANVKCIPGPYKNRQLIVSNTYLGIDGGCWSMLGQSAYFLWVKRRMNIGKGCESYATVLHELGHAFGLGHEHQRQDRDFFVEIIKENVSDPYFGLNMKMNFSTQNDELLTPYDFWSIMHYSRAAFSKNGNDTIKPRPGYEGYANVMGQAKHISLLDQQAMQKLYGVLF